MTEKRPATDETVGQSNSIGGQALKMPHHRYYHYSALALAQHRPRPAHAPVSENIGARKNGLP